MSAGDSSSSLHSAHLVQHLVDRRGRVWQERTVVIKPNDDVGYGFSLYGQRPVFVDSVVQGGPAHKAGIKAGDRLIKVDGQNVFDKKHPEVINLLKGATVVSLTVITQYSQPSKGQSESSGPQRIQELTLNALRSMLEKQQRVYEQLILDYSKVSSERLEQELRECEEIIKTLQAEIAVKASTAVEAVTQSTEASINSLLGNDKAAERRCRLARDDSILAQKILCTITNDENETNQPVPPTSLATPPPLYSVGSPMKSKSPKPFRKASLSKMLLHSTDSNPPSGASSPTKNFGRSQSMLNDSDLSDEDLEFGTPQYGPFSSLQELNNYPAHMSVFLHYLFQNKDPKYLCFYLVAQSYQNHYKGNDLKQKGLEITWTFCMPTSPLYVDLDESVAQKIIDTLEKEESEMRLKSVFVESRDVVANRIAEDLSAYRHKRTLGLGSMFGEQQLTDHMTASRESEVSNMTLTKILKNEVLADKLETIEDVNRNHALSDSVCTFLMDITKGKAKYDSSLADRVQSFTRTEVTKRKIGKVKKQSRCGHNFQLTTYQRYTLCDFCDRVLWGIIFQGYQCCVCEMNVHRFGCVEENLEICTGKKKDRSKRRASRKASSGQQSNTSTSDLDRSSEALHQTNEEDGGDPGEDTEPFSSRRRSVSDPKQTLMAVNLNREEESVQEEMFRKRIKPIATVSRTQSLKERRSHGDSTHPLSSQDTSLNTTPSWNSVASSSSMSDESLNASSLSTGAATIPSASGISKGSTTLDTVMEGNGKQNRAKSPFHIDDEAWQELNEANVEEELIPWAMSTRSEVVKSLQKFEIQRQELIKEFIHTERTHLKKLQIMKHIYRNPLSYQGILSLQQAEMLFPSLEDLVVMHSSFCSDLRDRQAQYADGVIHNIADILLNRFEGQAGERLYRACSVFASNQTKAEKLIKEYTAKTPKFKKFIQDAEANPYCNRRSLKDLLPCVWTRLTRYQLLVEQILKLNKKNFDKMKPEDKEESSRLEAALACIINICNVVNRLVKQSENRQKLHQYQMKLDTSQLERTTHPIIEKYKELNLTSEGRVLLHESTLTLKISQRKTVEVRALLLNDIFVLLSVPEDGSDKFQLKRYFMDSVGGVRDETSPVIRLKEMILRDYAGDKGGRSFLLINNSPLMTRAQMYVFTAENVQEKKKWVANIERAMKKTTDAADVFSPDEYSIAVEDTFTPQIAPLMSNIALRDQLNKIDESIQKQLDDKLALLRALQGVDRQDSITSTPRTSSSVVENTADIFHTVGELTSQISKLLIPSPAKSIVADVQYQLTELTSHLHTGLSALLVSLGKDTSGLDRAAAASDGQIPSSPQLDEASDTTVSPSEDQYIMMNVNESTPNATPLPNGSHTYMDSLPLPLSPSLPTKQELLHDRELDNETDEEGEGSPPPLPHKPPPSSSSASSATPPDLLEDESSSIDIVLPRASSEFSMESYDLQSESFTRIIPPPEDFSAEFSLAASDGFHSNHRSLPPAENKREGFRRVRSNPSIASTKVMSVISSASISTGAAASKNVKRTNSEDVDEYIVKLKSTERKS